MGSFYKDQLRCSTGIDLMECETEVLDYEPAQSKNKIRVLVVDDQPVLRDTLMLLLQDQEDISVIGAAGDGDTAASLARAMRPDVILMDFSMPGVNGLQATKSIHSEMPEIQIIGLSMFGEIGYAEAMLGAGAVNYICKGSSFETVLDAVRACSPI